MSRNPFIPDRDLLPEARERAERIAIGSGGVEYLQELAKKISKESAAKAKVPKQFTVRRGAELVTVKTSVRTYAPRRYLKTGGLQELRERYPAAYAAAVSIKPPEHPYQVRLDAPGRGKSQHWAALRAQGEARMEQWLRQRWGSGGEWNPIQGLQHLFDLRQAVKPFAENLAQQKQDLILFITDNDLPLRIEVAADGRLVLRENTPSTVTDFDVLERQFPAIASGLVRRSVPKKDPEPYVMLREVVPEVEDEDDHEQDEDDWAARWL